MLDFITAVLCKFTNQLLQFGAAFLFVTGHFTVLPPPSRDFKGRLVMKLRKYHSINAKKVMFSSAFVRLLAGLCQTTRPILMRFGGRWHMAMEETIRGNPGHMDSGI